ATEAVLGTGLDSPADGGSKRRRPESHPVDPARAARAPSAQVLMDALPTSPSGSVAAELDPLRQPRQSQLARRSPRGGRPPPRPPCQSTNPECRNPPSPNAFAPQCSRGCGGQFAQALP